MPFLEWCHVVCDDPSLTLENLTLEPGTYLLPDFDDGNPETLIRGFFDVIFAHELVGWMTDDTRWPTNRSFTVFLEWFDVEFSSMVFDLAPGPFVYEDL
jgi:hypothetical protein